MNRTQEIAKLLNVPIETAEKVRDVMDDSGIDYSECEQSEFDDTARACYKLVITTEHTPTPWEVNQWASGIEISAPDQHYTVALLRDCNNAEANAAFIVTACNSHAALVEALENLEYLARKTGAFTKDAECLTAAREALRMAQG